jgi:hypothetical protein
MAAWSTFGDPNSTTRPIQDAMAPCTAA